MCANTLRATRCRARWCSCQSCRATPRARSSNASCARFPSSFARQPQVRWESLILRGTLRVPRQAQQSLGDDVQLHLGGAAVDRRRTAGQQILGPAPLGNRGRRSRRRPRTTLPRTRRIPGRSSSTAAWRWRPTAWRRRRPMSAGWSAGSGASRVPSAINSPPVGDRPDRSVHGR